MKVERGFGFVYVVFSVPWKPGGLNTECEEHEAYLSKFRELVSAKLQTLINRSLEEEPEIKARNKTVQVSNMHRANDVWNFVTSQKKKRTYLL
jgi:hypothetical protein